MAQLQFAAHAYKARATPLSAQRCVNYFAESTPPDSKSPVLVYNAPGIKAFGAGGLVGQARGLKVMADVLYVVAGNTFYSVTSAGVATALGTINTAVGLVSMAVNQASPQQLCLVDGIEGWTYDTTNGLVRITDVDFQAADTVTFQDGYFILNRAGTSQFFISELGNGQSYRATDFANAEGSPDLVVAVFSNHRELWVFGEETTEVYFNSGNDDFPFERIPGAYLERGCAAAFSIADDDNTLFWLGDDGVIYRANGYRPQRISTHAIEEEIRTFTTTVDAHAFFTTISGHKFYHIIFPTGRMAFVYDVATGIWHERESFGDRHWSAVGHAKAYGKDIIGDAFQGRLGELDLDTFSEYGGTMQGILTTPVIHRDRKRVFHNRIEIDIESGVGDTTGTYEDPQMWLDYSDDGGRTWSLRKPARSMGKIGEYKKRLIWRRRGQSRSRIYRFTTAAQVKRSIVGAYLDAKQGTN